VVTQIGDLAKGEENPTLGSAIARRNLEIDCTLNTGKFHLGEEIRNTIIKTYLKTFPILFIFLFNCKCIRIDVISVFPFASTIKIARI